MYVSAGIACAGVAKPSEYEIWSADTLVPSPGLALGDCTLKFCYLLLRLLYRGTEEQQTTLNGFLPRFHLRYSRAHSLVHSLVCTKHLF